MAHVLNLAIQDGAVSLGKKFQKKIVTISSIAKKYHQRMRHRHHPIGKLLSPPEVCTTRWNTNGEFCAWLVENFKWFSEAIDKINRKEVNSKRFPKCIEYFQNKDLMANIAIEGYIVKQFASPFLEDLHLKRGKNSFQLFSILEKANFFFMQLQTNFSNVENEIVIWTKDFSKK